MTDVSLHGNPAVVACRELLRRSAPTLFEIVENNEEANIILYVENGYLGLSELPKLLHRMRCAQSAMHFVFSECDCHFLSCLELTHPCQDLIPGLTVGPFFLEKG